jgi:hypothetical protein
MSLSEFEVLIHLTGEKISEKDTVFRKASSIQENLALTLLFWQVVIRTLACGTFSNFPISSHASGFFNFVKMHLIYGSILFIFFNKVK